MFNRQLLIEFLQIYALQPATAFWRSVEFDVLRKYLHASGTVLDLGCGDGKLTVMLFKDLPKRDFHLFGIDSDEDETHQAALDPLYSRVHTCLASNIPELSETFDHVISNSVLEHIEDIQPTISEVARLLKPGGTFTFTVPSAGFHSCLRGPLLSGVSRETYLQEMDKRLAHFRYWDVNDWQEILVPVGLHVEHQEEYLSLVETRRWETISRFTAGILYTLNGKKDRPIELQKKLGLRKAQNKIKLPVFFVKLLAKFLTMRLKDSPVQNSCLLVQAKKSV